MPSLNNQFMDRYTNVDVYYNLHHKVWSIKCRKTGRVVAHANVVISDDPVQFVVRKSGRARAIREGRKNVHAFVRVSNVVYAPDMYAPDRVSYTPSYAPTFYNVKTRAPVYSAPSVAMIAPHNAPPQVRI